MSVACESIKSTFIVFSNTCLFKDRFICLFILLTLLNFYNTNIFPFIFNVADSALVIGVIMLIIYMLFLDKDAVFRIKGNGNGN